MTKTQDLPPPGTCLRTDLEQLFVHWNKAYVLPEFSNNIRPALAKVVPGMIIGDSVGSIARSLCCVEGTVRGYFCEVYKEKISDDQAVHKQQKGEKLRRVYITWLLDRYYTRSPAIRITTLYKTLRTWLANWNNLTVMRTLVEPLFPEIPPRRRDVFIARLCGHIAEEIPLTMPKKGARGSLPSVATTRRHQALLRKSQGFVEEWQLYFLKALLEHSRKK